MPILREAMIRVRPAESGGLIAAILQQIVQLQQQQLQRQQQQQERQEERQRVDHDRQQQQQQSQAQLITAMMARPDSYGAELDRLHESLCGAAASFASTLPEGTWGDYKRLT